MNDEDTSLIDRLARFDAQRPSLPGEHWLTFALGVYLLLRSRRSSAGRLASMAAGALFVGRALTGRDGPIAALRDRDRQDHGTDFAEVAAPWPYDRRVRLSTPRRTRRGARPIASEGESARPRA
jgi:hypothetical protein